MSEGYDALRGSAAWVDLSERGRLTAKGRDRARLLHNITTNEVKKLAPGSGCYAFMLTPQGRIQSDIDLLCFDDHFLIDTEPETRERVRQHVLKYKVADQVELEDLTESTASAALEGPAAAAVLASLQAPVPGADHAHVAWGEVTIAAVSLTGEPGFRLYAARSEFAGLIGRLESAGAKRATAEDVRLVRIENGKPRFGEDIRETTLPQETQQMQAISFNKGCYIGQEIVERIRAQGHVNKKLMRVELNTEVLPAPGTKLSADGAEAGEITSSVFSPRFGKVIAMAYVRTASAVAGTRVAAGDLEGAII